MKLFDFFKRKPKTYTIKPTVLVVLDGWGVAPDSSGNAISRSQLPHWHSLWDTYPHGELIAAGESVGLPANEVGNTEVGHLTLGAGRVVDQDVQRINKAIENGSFFDNASFLGAINHAKTHNSKLHLLGLVGSGNVHASLTHLYALLDLCNQNQFYHVFIHAFTDGRDSAPQEALSLISRLEEKLRGGEKGQRLGTIATVSGRYYALDRDKRWDRTEKTYRALVEGVGPSVSSVREAIEKIYQEGKSDEFVVPSIITQNGKPIVTIDDNDAVIFFNFRIDRPRQLTMAFTLPDFEKLRSFEFGYSPEQKKVEGTVSFEAPFVRNKIPKNLFFVTMTQYQKTLPVSAIAFDEMVVPNPLPVILAENKHAQLRLTESEKERFVTYYFSGLREDTLPGEEVVIIPSPRVPTYDKKPDMSTKDVIKAFSKEIEKDQFHFVIINFPNPDIVAHTGNLPAAIKACETVDWALGELIRMVITERGGNLIITADHGNVEEMLTYNKNTFFFTTDEGRRNTDHSNNPVPLIVASPSLQGQVRTLPKGTLADVAPTILSLMGLPIPKEMTGKDLLQT